MLLRDGKPYVIRGACGVEHLAEKGQVVIRTPSQPGNYRLFAIVRDGKGAASAENLCFRVEAR